MNKLRRKILFFTFLFSTFRIFAQETIVEYEYWFNDDYANKINTPISPVSSYVVNASVSVNGLINGLNVINFRAKDAQGKYSSTVSQFFYKTGLNNGTSNDIVAYEYWFNNDYQNKTVVTVTQTAQAHVISQINVSSLVGGMHVFNYRAMDERGYYSSTIQQFFYKKGLNNGTNNEVATYEYWFDDDYQNRTVVTVTQTTQAHVMAQINVSSLVGGMHIFNYRAMDERGYYSSTVQQFFYKKGLNNGTNNEVVAYEYWFDDDYQNKTVVTVTQTVQSHVMAQIDVSALNTGMHIFNFRVIDDRGYFSSTTQQFFYKKAECLTAGQEIISYKYWFDNNHMNAIHIQLQNPVNNFHLIDLSDIKHIPKGPHTIHFQFEDITGFWSVISTDTIEKISLPIADFSYTVVTATCDSTTIDFTDLSIDGDIYQWDFGDGTTDSLANPTHTYYNPGTYTVNLTISDSITLQDSTNQDTFLVTGNTDSSFMVTSCDSYISPSGNYTFTNSGIYNDTILNQWGCDSIMTINLTINNSSAYTDIINACDSFTWIDGNTYTASNNTATHILTNTVGCDSVVSLDLTVNYTTTGTDIINACDSFTWTDGNTYTASNNTATHTLTNTAGCDSVVTLDLTINYTPDNTVSQSGITLTANAIGVNYQWLDCDSNFMPLVGETNQSFTATANGHYAVEVSNNGCLDTSACFLVTPIGILENSFGYNFALYPNPTDGKFSIDLGKEYNDIILSILNLNGQLVRKIFYSNQRIIEIDLIENQGVYFLIVDSNKNKAILKVIKN